LVLERKDNLEMKERRRKKKEKEKITQQILYYLWSVQDSIIMLE